MNDPKEAARAGTETARSGSAEEADSSVTRVAVGLLVRDGLVLCARRPQGRDLAGFWEFPGGKVEPGETHGEALARELREELGVETEPASVLRLESLRWNYGGGRKDVELVFFAVRGFKGEPRAREGQELAWVPGSRLADLDLLPATRHVLDGLLASDALK